MGHASITTTLEPYGHLYPGGMDRSADRHPCRRQRCPYRRLPGPAAPPGTGCAEPAPEPPPPQLLAPLTVHRRVSIRGAIMIGGQRI